MTNQGNFQQYTDQQISAWLRGLLTIAYADGHFDEEEQEFINNLTQNELVPNTEVGKLEVISPEELANALGDDHDTKENFLRTAVMIAISNGVYSQAEAETVESFQKALGLEIEALKSLESTLWNPEIAKDGDTDEGKSTTDLNILQPVKKWLDGMDVKDPRVARFICKMVPSQCPFERDIVLFGKKIVHIPPMCKLNPLYEQLVGLRFRSLSFLADECKEDVTPYI
jgi:tellurite resistance protein